MGIDGSNGEASSFDPPSQDLGCSGLSAAGADAGPKRTTRLWIGCAVLAIWAGFSMVAGLSLMAGHWYTLPAPNDRVRLAEELNELRREDEAGRWLAVHVLYADCRCSQRIIDDVVGREAEPNVKTKILWVVDPDEQTEVAARRIVVAAEPQWIVVNPEELADRYGIEAAPMFIAVDPQGSIRYLGGYTERKQGPSIQDRETMRRLVAGEVSPELPLFGCAVGLELQRLLDPLGIKYDRRDAPDREE